MKVDNLFKSKRGFLIKSAILDQVAQHPGDIAKVIGEEFLLTRQAVNKHIQELIKDDYLTAQGTTHKKYQLGQRRFGSGHYDLSRKQDESEIWYENFANLLSDAPKNIKNICDFGFTEMVNNAIDHSGGTLLSIMLAVEEDYLIIHVVDDGEGIFKRITRMANLPDERLAILELAKGKYTTDPRNHTGQGIFFTSKAFDEFWIESQGLIFSANNRTSAPMIEKKVNFLNIYKGTASTLVTMKINLNSKTELKDIFDHYALAENDYEFDRTRVPVKLASYEQSNLMSRSQAKRLLANLEKFREIELDFSGVEIMGQGFADQVFRVFQQQHPEIKLHVVNANPDVEKMIGWVQQVK